MGPVYPDVPATEGVPPVKRGPDNPGNVTTDRIDADAITVTATGRNQWGIYTLDGKLALEPDSINAVSYNAEHRIADFPIEEGGFESYDKVAVPFDVRVVMSKGGDQGHRRDFLNAVEVLRGDLKLYNVITPERTYANVNITRLSLDRTREAGAGMITVEIFLREIRQEVTASFSKAKNPASADPVNNGSAQTKSTAPSTDGVK